MADRNELDVSLMRLALEEARSATEKEEVPVGAVIVIEGRVIARASNSTLRDCDPTAHAEMVALRAAAREIGNHRLVGATLYVTLEPCAMCAGAMIQARVARLVYAADDPKGGAVHSCFSLFDQPNINHRVEMTSGVMAKESAEILQAFFAAKR